MTSWSHLIDEYCEILKTRCATLNLSQVFAELPANERVSFTYDLLKCDNVLPNFMKCHTKSTARATEFRNLGNRAFGRKQDVDALKYYVNSVAAAPIGSPELALAYANRSAVLFRLGKYSLSLVDVNRALNNNYPDSLKHKLLNRKKECSAKIDAQTDIQMIHLDVSMKLAILPEDNNRNQQRVDVEKDCLNRESITRSTRTECENKFRLPATNFENRRIPNASEKISLHWSSEMGRHLVATRDMKPGEMLAVEKPYASILLPKFYSTHCSYCFVRCPVLTPCNGCSLVMFCGNSCYQRALNLYHRTECGILSFLVSLELGKMELLALRTLLIASEQGKKLNNLRTHPIFGNPFAKRPFGANQRYISHDYLSVHNLEDNFAQRSVAELFRRSAAAVILLYALKHSSFFNTDVDTKNLSHAPLPPLSLAPPLSLSGDELTDMETFAGTLLLKYLLAIVSNAHEVSELIELQNSLDKTTNTKSVEIGAALYPLLSLTNHSCDPNVVRHNYGDGVVLRTIQPISEGDQLFDNYGYHYAIHSRAERQSHLSLQYFFECRCDPCRLDWPLHKNLPSVRAKYLPDRRVDSEKLERCSEIFRKSLQKPLNWFTDEQFDFLLEYLWLLHASVERPWKEYNECQESIKQIMAYRANHYTLADFIL